MGRITSYDENGRLMAVFDKDAYGPYWFHRGEWPESINQNEGVKLAANLRRLEEDNAKLRELVRDIDTVHTNGYDCTECPFYDECVTDGGCIAWAIIHDRMHELGVEVVSV